LASWGSLHSLQLDGNPFHCTCDLLWLQELLTQEKFENTSSFVHCSEPRELEGTRLIEVTSENLQCYLQGPVEKTILGVSIAVAIILLALIFFLLYRYHDKIQNACKRCFKRPGSRGHGRSSVVSSGKDLATKSSFLSQGPYACPEEECREPFMYGHPQNGGSHLHHDYHHPTLSMHYYTGHQNGHHGIPLSNPTSSTLHHLNSLHSNRHHYPPTSSSANGNTYTLPNFANNGNSGNEYASPYNAVNHFGHHGSTQMQPHTLHPNYPIPYPISHETQHKREPITEL